MDHLLEITRCDAGEVETMSAIGEKEPREEDRDATAVVSHLKAPRARERERERERKGTPFEGAANEMKPMELKEKEVRFY